MFTCACACVNQENFWKLVLYSSYGSKDPTQVVRFRLHEFFPSESLNAILEQFVALRVPHRYLGQIPSPPRLPANLALTPLSTEGLGDKSLSQRAYL